MKQNYELHVSSGFGVEVRTEDPEWKALARWLFFGFGIAEELSTILAAPERWRKYDASREYCEISIRGNRVWGRCGVDDRDMVEFTMSAEKAGAFLKDYLDFRCRSFPELAAKKEAEVRRQKKAWRQVQLSGKMWPMP